MWKERVKRSLVSVVRRLPADVLDELAARLPHEPAAAAPPDVGLLARIESLEERVYLYNSLFYKAFEVAGFGDYLEFGVFTGGTLANAYRAAHRFYRLLAVEKVWGDDGGAGQTQWDAMRFIGFDSFEGLPAPTGVDRDRPVFAEGEYAASTDQVWETLARNEVDTSKVKLIEGYFKDTCTPATASALGLHQLSVVHIDSDLYESAATALEFCTPYFRDGSVVIFDEWMQFGASPDYGEQKAFGEWRQAHPEWRAAELAREGAGRMAFVLSRIA
jgi:hypothetical protein